MIVIILFAIIYGSIDSVHDRRFLDLKNWHSLDLLIKCLVCCTISTAPYYLNYANFLDPVIIFLNLGVFYWISHDLTWCIINYNKVFCVPTKGGKIDRILGRYQYVIKFALLILVIFTDLCRYCEPFYKFITNLLPIIKSLLIFAPG